MSRAAAATATVDIQSAMITPREFEYRPDDFLAIAQLLEERTGIHLPPHKDQLVYSRLAKRLRALGLPTFAAYRAYLAEPEGGGELMRMVNALTTNLTRFFREPHHFAHLKAHLADLVGRKSSSRRLRLWSAGCSTGPEPYSLALVLRDVVPDLAKWDAKILATDIDTDVLSLAEAGRYARDAIADVPGPYQRYFTGLGTDEVEVAAKIRGLVTFKPLNLIGPWPFKGPFDAIFCRNVAIYFAPETQTQLFARFRDMLTEDGYLYIGHSETLPQLSDRLELVGQTIYRRC